MATLRATVLPRLQEVRPKVADSAPVDARAAAVGFAETAGVRIPDIQFNAFTIRNIPHRLQRQPIGWRVIDATGSAPGLYRISWDEEYIRLTHGGAAATTVTLWVW